MNDNPSSHPSTSARTHRRAVGRAARARGFGAGIVATIAAGIAFATVVVDAAPVADESTFVPITPCRLFDTRPGGDTVGDRSSPIGPGETLSLQVTGSNGNCSIPAGASAVALNATAVGATAASFATFWPSGEARPLSSNLNYVPGQPPTPNKVDVRLSADGRIDVYNAFGRVDMLADVMGYYRDAGVRELADRLDELEASLDAIGDGSDSGVIGRLDALEDSDADQEALLGALVDSLPGLAESKGTNGFLPWQFTTKAEVSITSDTGGRILVTSHAIVGSETESGARCFISDEEGAGIMSYMQVWQGHGASDAGAISGARVFQVAPGTHVFRLRCQALGGEGTLMANIHLSAIEFPTAFWVPIGVG